jgi:hypothetical protein
MASNAIHAQSVIHIALNVNDKKEEEEEEEEEEKTPHHNITVELKEVKLVISNHKNIF